MPSVQIKVAEKLLPLIVTPKRLKVAVGGRAGSKSIAFGDAFLRFCDAGERLCCAREFQNSIEDSVHAQLSARIEQLQVESLNAAATKIHSASGGEIFYRGLSRNITAFKSTFGLKRLWIEEGQTLSRDTIETVLPTIRSGPEDDSEPPEIWISANRGASNDAFSQAFLRPYEKHLTKYGFYEDDDILIVEINYWDNPFFPPDMEQQRKRDFSIMPRARYDHIWCGKYSDTVQNAIIFPEWFDACIDAHEKLGFKPSGIEVVTHDPSDMGGDPKALCYRHGSIIVDVRQKEDGDINEGADWALDYAIMVQCDEFKWDGDGVGAGIRRQVGEKLKGKKIKSGMFKGSEGVDFPDKVYEPIDGEVFKPKPNKEIFLNKRAQYYWALRDRCFKTFLAVTKGIYTNPDEMISFSSDIADLDILRSEVCRIPRKENGGGKIQLASKPDMKKKPYELESPNMADCVMMSLSTSGLKRERKQSQSTSDSSNVSWQAM